MYPAETCAGNGAKMATVKLYYLNNSGSDAIINATEWREKNVHLWIVFEIFKINKYT